MAEGVTRWGPSDDAKLLKLFSLTESKGGILTTNLSPEYIKTVHNQHFKNRKLEAFRSLFKRKARAWNVGKSKTGARKGK